jgi:hypothetical protein
MAVMGLAAPVRIVSSRRWDGSNGSDTAADLSGSGYLDVLVCGAQAGYQGPDGAGGVARHQAADCIADPSFEQVALLAGEPGGKPDNIGYRRTLPQQ